MQIREITPQKTGNWTKNRKICYLDDFYIRKMNIKNRKDVQNSPKKQEMGTKKTGGFLYSKGGLAGLK